MQITENMVREFNALLSHDGSLIRLKYIKEPTYTKCEIGLCNSVYIDSFILNPSNKFYNYLEWYFANRGIKLSYNNTRHIFWSKDTD